MNRLLLFLFLLPALLHGAPAAPAAPAVPAPSNGAGQLIEPGLAYRRVHTLPDDLPVLPPNSATGTLVLDLRFVSASPAATTAFAEWLKARARPQAPVLVLVNPGTTPGLLAPLTAPGVPPGVVSIGPAVSDAVPDVAINLAAGADRTAYDALEHGTPLADLINPKIDKVRHDEAAMARERAAGAGTDDEDDTPVATNEKPGPPPAAPPVAPIDRVLQRAVQLHHALLALKKV